MKEAVKYHNDLNTTVMRNWKPTEMNIFFGIIPKLRDNKEKVTVFSADEVRELTDNKENRPLKYWYEDMIGVSRNISQLNYYCEDEECYVLMMLFSKFEINKKEKTLTVKFSEYFEYILNQLNANFTSHELREFVNLKSSYSKTMYRLLKQWRTVGKKIFLVEEFYLLLDIPKSYSKGAIDKQILEPIINELSVLFENLEVKKIKESTRGNPITHYEFTWKPQENRKYIKNG